MAVRILQGDALAMIRTLPSESVHCVVTSPPYWGLRDYGVAGQMGLEPTLGEHIEAMVAVFREVRRVLRKDGTCWLNYGDCYATAPNGRSAAATKALGQDDRTFRDKPFSTVGGTLKPKDLCMMPNRLAIALQDDGWWVRSEIIWAKLNPMPESIRDRPTCAHEKIFLLTKAARYFYDAEAVREDRTSDEDGATFRGGSYVGGQPGKRTVTGNRRLPRPAGWATGDTPHNAIAQNRPDKQRGHGPRHAGFNERWADGPQPPGRNLRNVWTIATSPFPDAHFATFPPEIPARCIRAGTSERGCCSACGASWVREVERPKPPEDVRNRGEGTKLAGKHPRQVGGGQKIQDWYDANPPVTRGFTSSCQCNAEIVPCTVLDPFGGAGTVGLVADRLQRDAILIELNPDYCDMARRRIEGEAGLFAAVSAPFSMELRPVPPLRSDTGASEPIRCRMKVAPPCGRRAGNS